jgi:hypothetical protein
MTTATEATMEAINQHMTQMTAVATNTSMKLNALSDLNLPLGRKLDGLADLSAATEWKLDWLIGALARRTE